LRWHCGLLRSGHRIELVHVRNVGPWNQVAVRWQGSQPGIRHCATGTPGGNGGQGWGG